MSPYNTRSAVRKQALEPYKNAIVSPSATGKGTHIRWTYSSEEVPTLSHSSSLDSEASFDRPATPDQDEDDEYQRSSSVEIPDEPSSPIVQDDRYSAAERAVMERMLTELQQQKVVVEERAWRRSDGAKGPEHRHNLQVESNRPTNPRAEEVRTPLGPKLPLGIVGFGRSGTWVVDDVWRPEHAPSTNQLPSIRELEEEREVQNSLLNITQENLGGNAGFRTLTPLPSFVTGNEAAKTR
jgi:hypothetical protein